jgi:hypothetical protein
MYVLRLSRPSFVTALSSGYDIPLASAVVPSFGENDSPLSFLELERVKMRLSSVNMRQTGKFTLGSVQDT